MVSALDVFSTICASNCPRGWSKLVHFILQRMAGCVSYSLRENVVTSQVPLRKLSAIYFSDTQHKFEIMKKICEVPALHGIAAAFLCTAILAGSITSADAQAAPAMKGVALDALDDNRFFTRTGGTLRDQLSYEGLIPGQPYTLTSELINMTTGERFGDIVTTVFAPDQANGDVSIELPVGSNLTDFNIDLHVVTKVYEGEIEIADLAHTDPVLALEDEAAEGRVVQLHAIQGIFVTAMDASDGDNQLPPEGGTIIAKVEHVNLVEGYAYALWGQLLTPSGQTSGIYATVAEYVPKEKKGALEMTFVVPEGFEGLKLMPSVGLFHKKRIIPNADGTISWVENAPAPIMIASDINLDMPEKTIRVGVPFEE